MPIIKCPECGKEVSSYAKKCIHCGFPLSKCEIPKDIDAGIISAPVQIKKRRPLFLILALLCIIPCVIFTFLFVFTLDDWRTMFFTENTYYQIAQKEIGSSEKSEEINGLNYVHRLNADDEIILMIGDDKYHFEYYLSNTEMRIHFCDASWNPLVSYKMTNDGLEVSDEIAADSETINLANTMRGLCDSIINIDLGGKCTIDDLLLEYYHYGLKINAIKICGITFAVLFLSASVVLLVLYFKKPKRITSDVARDGANPAGSRP